MQNNLSDKRSTWLSRIALSIDYILKDKTTAIIIGIQKDSDKCKTEF